ncbi:shikimate dehydrogenase [Microlunatus sagamiharensis]|uniref:Shikimate dehydrogenase n=1 Tax=Microlunatus sagamiharensis TaxID=546874 RepID=A0A1H2M6J9_9ACTN|nr:shikimate dehydrogenase [Microlunatus sagamiharensis]SDU88863.1 shikimate dehydrogenase [Microlunatus sagamiharensis]
MTAEPGSLVRHRAAVLGSPIAHSLSPALHAAAYAELGMAGWSYGLAEVEADGLAAFVDGLDETWRGLSLTMPLKVAVLELDGVEVSETARLAGAGNTLLLDERRVENTDVAGLVWAVRSITQDPVATVSVVGSGATARSALVAAPRLGATTVQVLARDPAKARSLAPLAEAVGVELAVPRWGSAPPEAGLLVSTVTAGAVDDQAEALAASAGVVFDVVYDPWPTALADAAGRAGVRVLDGLDLLVGQAVEQVELMTGRRPSPEVLRAAGDRALAERA